MALTTTQIVEKYERDQNKQKIAKVEAKAMGLQAIEWGTAAAGFVGLGALEEWKPELFKYELPRVAAALSGLGLYIFVGKKHEKLREVGSGLFMAGVLPLAALGAKKAVAYAKAA